MKMSGSIWRYAIRHALVVVTQHLQQHRLYA
jgi:hypothetical protein